jgi:ABC-type lipoprotein export system ATPase subunit
VIWLEGIFSQRSGVPVLDGVTVGVSAGELAVLQGPVGSGKSTLLAIAAGLRTPDAGAVWLAERNITALQRSSLPFVRRNVGYLPQQALLIPDETALENVMLALAVRGEAVDAAEADAREVLAMLGDSSWEDRLAGSLSVGEQRLVALAGALVGPPPLVVLDEPAAALGDDEREAILQALGWVRSRAAAVLCATADARFADALVAAGGRRVHIEAGHIVGAPPIGLVPVPLQPLNEGETVPDETVAGEEVTRLPGRLSGKEPA